MILGTDQKKLSKRHGAAAVEEWREQGILPEALFNFLALLGWAPGGDREILTREEMEREFSLEKVGPSPSVFDPEKLLWMNAQYMAKLPGDELLERSAPYAAAGVPPRDVALRRSSSTERGRARQRNGPSPASYARIRPSTRLRASRSTSGQKRRRTWRS